MRHVLRRLIQRPLFTTVAILTLGVGIGANTAIFSVIQGILLKPLPYPHPEDLVDVDHSAPGVGVKSAGAAPFLYFTYRSDAHALQDVGLWRGDTSSITGRGEPEEVDEVDVTYTVLPILGVQPAVGRPFSQKDDSPGSPETVIVTFGYWKSKLGGDTSVVGQTLLVDGRPREIIGILPDRFRFLDRKPALFIPLRLDPNKTFLGNFSYSGLARLTSGATIATANAEAAHLIPIALQRFPPFPGYSAKMFDDARLAPNVRPLKASLVGDIGNVLLLESVTLGVLGGIFGLGLAYGSLRVLLAVAPATLPRLDEIAIDGVVLGFTFAISIAAGLLFGSIPVFKYVGPQLTGALRGGGRTSSDSRERHRARNTLVVVQVALALVLLVGSGLMIRTFQALRHVQPGFTRPEQVQTLRIAIPRSQVREPEQVVRMEQAIVEKIAAVPGVSSVGLTSYVPMSGNGWQDPVFADDRVDSDQSKIPPLRRFKFISPGLLRTLGNTVVAGRDFTWADIYDKRPVAMVSENLARELWHEPGAAIGRRVRESLKAEWREIVGVVSDERDDGVDKKAPTIAFWPIMMAKFEGDDVFVQRSLAYVIRSSRTGSSGFINEVSRAVWSVNPNLPLASVRTLQELYAGSMARTSFTLVTLAIAGAMALVLGVAGVYGVIAYSVSQRTREIGIRIALGARRGEVTRLFVVHGLRLAGIGVVCGLAAAVSLTRLMSSLLFDVRAIDPLTYGAVGLGLAAAAALASYVPALQAATVDPVDALRAE